ncbi:MAG: low specificity L-threonine aldolase [Lachnospiraceae bacterium]|nr:low specificity L-threonine aldolase [Lachnospiraceae bacterium]
MSEKLYFVSDYMEGAHPAILNKLTETNLVHTQGYGTDEFCASAREKIKEACACPDAEVHFLTGGTQANLICTGALLASYQGVIAAESGHINVHEAGAIEHTGHKVLALPQHYGKLDAAEVCAFLEGFYADANHEHMVMPGMVYISHPTEFGTLYSLKELTELSTLCRAYHIPLYLDGARLAYALACPDNDLTLPDIARLCDIFYIGGTKCGALFGEAVVVTDPALIPHFFTIIKQHGALLAKGRILGIQFDVLFTDHLYENIGKTAIDNALLLKKALADKGYTFAFPSPTNQTFVTLENERMKELARDIAFDFWENIDESHTVIRFATSWATTREDTEKLISLL